MPISHKHKVLFLHAPKNAGSSIEEALGIEKSPQALLSHKYTADSIYALQHLPYSQLRKTVPTTVWSTYTKVCVVRNPWDRMVSDWRWRRKNGLPLGQLSFGDFVRFVQMVLSDPDWDGGVSNSGRGEGAKWNATRTSHGSCGCVGPGLNPQPPRRSARERNERLLATSTEPTSPSA